MCLQACETACESVTIKSCQIMSNIAEMLMDPAISPSVI